MPVWAIVLSTMDFKITNCDFSYNLKVIRIIGNFKGIIKLAYFIVWCKPVKRYIGKS